MKKYAIEIQFFIVFISLDVIMIFYCIFIQPQSEYYIQTVFRGSFITKIKVPKKLILLGHKAILL